MDEKTEKLIGKRMKDGWIKSTMMIEVLAVNKDTAKSSLQKHVEKMEREDKAMVCRKEFRKIEKVKNPIPRIPEAYSNVVELELLTQNYDKLIYMVMTYAPSSVEILEPEHIRIDMGEAQGILNSVADLIHKFAAAGLGGVIVGS
jgi:hypothetical protein